APLPRPRHGCARVPALLRPAGRSHPGGHRRHAGGAGTGVAPRRPGPRPVPPRPAAGRVGRAGGPHPPTPAAAARPPPAPHPPARHPPTPAAAAPRPPTPHPAAPAAAAEATAEMAAAGCMTLHVGLAGAGPWARFVHGPVLAAGPETELTAVWARRRVA